MADLFVWWGRDLTILPSGDLLIADGTVEGEQRVLRRLLTSPGAYIWHPEYGAGLPAYVGQPANPSAMQALILANMLMEAAVASSPLPVVQVTAAPPGYLTADIKYVDATTGVTVATGFDLSS
jgi:phage baseplate assembly protein W